MERQSMSMVAARQSSSPKKPPQEKASAKGQFETGLFQVALAF